MASHSHHNHGFALIALATVLVVASMAVVLALLARDAEATWAARIAAKDRVQNLGAVLVKFQREHHRLPCPAPLNIAQSNPLHGIEVSACSEGGVIAGVTRLLVGSVAVRIGALPVRTLGLSDSDGEDAQGARLTYAVVEPLTSPFQFSDMGGALTVQSPSGAALLTGAAYVLVSHGENRIGAIAAKTGALLRPCNSGTPEEQENCDGDSIFVVDDVGEDAATGAYDDALAYAIPDSEARGRNTPCYTPRTATPFTWGAGCSGTFSAVLHGVVQPIANTAPGYTGSANAVCTNGMLSLQSGSCTLIPTAPCALPWGGSIAHGASVTAYQSGAVTCSNSCVSQVRSCSNGTLSGSYTAPSCSVGTCWKPKGLGVWLGALLCWTPTPGGTACASPGSYCNGDYAVCDGCLPLPHYFRCE